MDWLGWIGKRIYIQTVSGREYTGRVVNVDTSENPTLTWITIIDKYGKRVTFVHSEIALIKEDEKEEK